MILEWMETILYLLIPKSMPVRNRKYERVLQFIFGAVIALVLLNALYNVIIRVIHHFVR